MDPQAQLKHYLAHPPACISAFASQRADLAHCGPGGHGESLNPAFVLHCKCGGHLASVLGYHDEGCEELDSPLAVCCTSCGLISELFDERVHGYDGQFGHNARMDAPTGERAEFPCSECGTTELEVFVRISYPDDLFNGELAEVKGREQDYFSWLTVLGGCPKCSELKVIADFECS